MPSDRAQHLDPAGAAALPPPATHLPPPPPPSSGAVPGHQRAFDRQERVRALGAHCPRCGDRVPIGVFDLCAPCAAAAGFDPPCEACKVEARGAEPGEAQHVQTCAVSWQSAAPITLQVTDPVITVTGRASTFRDALLALTYCAERLRHEGGRAQPRYDIAAAELSKALAQPGRPVDIDALTRGAYEDGLGDGARVVSRLAGPWEPTPQPEASPVVDVSPDPMLHAHVASTPVPAGCPECAAKHTAVEQPERGDRG